MCSAQSQINIFFLQVTHPCQFYEFKTIYIKVPGSVSVHSAHSSQHYCCDLQSLCNTRLVLVVSNLHQIIL